jgi:hypothetical protein
MFSRRHPPPPTAPPVAGGATRDRLSAEYQGRDWGDAGGPDAPAEMAEIEEGGGA